MILKWIRYLCKTARYKFSMSCLSSLFRIRIFNTSTINHNFQNRCISISLDQNNQEEMCRISQSYVSRIVVCLTPRAPVPTIPSYVSARRHDFPEEMFMTGVGARPRDCVPGSSNSRTYNEVWYLKREFLYFMRYFRTVVSKF